MQVDTPLLHSAQISPTVFLTRLPVTDLIKENNNAYTVIIESNS